MHIFKFSSNIGKMAGIPLFFYQAEDGIRYYKVTGVQTCALPICTLTALNRAMMIVTVSATPRRAKRAKVRSEERRVGNACRARRSRNSSTNEWNWAKVSAIIAKLTDSTATVIL